MYVMPPATKILRAAIVGSPNAGKSTLLNCFFKKGQRIAAVSPKYNTTREQYLGVFTDRESMVQIVFTDTPGIVEQTDRKLYFQDLVLAATESIDVELVDVVLLVVDAAAKLSERRVNAMLEVRNLCIGQNLDMFLLFNKVDLIPNKRKLLPLTDKVNEVLRHRQNGDFTLENRAGQHVNQTCDEASQVFDVPAEVHYISAKENDIGIDILKQSLYSRAKVGEWLYDEDEFTELEDEEIVMEIIRQQLYQTYQKEVPYLVEQQTTMKQEVSPEHVFIEQTLYVPRESIRKVLQGRNFSVINMVKKKCERHLAEVYAELYGYERVDLKLVIKVRKQI